MTYPEAAWERAMTVQEVMLKQLRRPDGHGPPASRLRRFARPANTQHGRVRWIFGLVDDRVIGEGHSAREESRGRLACQP